ncbi:hypothetical protein LTR16_005363, partial [Cryomyces antarcticus]
PKTTTAPTTPKTKWRPTTSTAAPLTRTAAARPTTRSGTRRPARTVASTKTTTGRACCGIRGSGRRGPRRWEGVLGMARRWMRRGTRI